MPFIVKSTDSLLNCVHDVKAIKSYCDCSLLFYAPEGPTYFLLKDSSLKYCVHGLKAIDSDCHFFCYAILFIINTMYKS